MVYYTIDELLAMPQIPVTESDRRLIYCLFDRMPALKNAKRQHDDKDAEWIVTLLSTVMDSMPSLLASMARRSNRDRIDRMARKCRELFQSLRYSQAGKRGRRDTRHLRQSCKFGISLSPEIATFSAHGSFQA